MFDLLMTPLSYPTDTNFITKSFPNIFKLTRPLIPVLQLIFSQNCAVSVLNVYIDTQTNISSLK